MKKIKVLKCFNLLFSLVFIVISIFAYTTFFGNPISYLKANQQINKYINEKYQNSINLTIDSISYNTKMNGYGAKVSHEVDGSVGKEHYSYVNSTKY